MDPQGNPCGEHIPEVLSIKIIFCWLAILFLLKVRPLAKLTPLCYKNVLLCPCNFLKPQYILQITPPKWGRKCKYSPAVFKLKDSFEIFRVYRRLHTHPHPAKHKNTSPRQYIWQVIWQRCMWLAPTLVGYVISLWHKHLENYYNFRRWMDWS